MLDYLLALLLGLVEGLTEFLPVSSTAHLTLIDAATPFEDPTGSFKVMIQLGAILAVMWVYRDKILSTTLGLREKPEARRFALSLVVAFLPAMVIGAALADTVERVFLEGQISDQALAIIATVLIIGGFVMLAVEQFRPKPVDMHADALPLWKSLAIGFFQCIALIPGVSRSGASIVGAMLLKVDRRAGAEFSFFLAMPTMFGAFVYSLVRNFDELDFSQFGLIAIGFIAAFVSGLFVVRLFLGIVSRYGFAPFAWYRIVLGIGIFAAIALK